MLKYHPLNLRVRVVLTTLKANVGNNEIALPGTPQVKTSMGQLALLFLIQK